MMQRGGGQIVGGRGRGGAFGGMIAGASKARNVRATFRQLIKYLSPYKWSFVIVFIFSIASTVFSIIGPKILGNATTKLFEGVIAKISLVPGASIDFGYIGRIVLVVLILYFASAAFSYIAGLIMARVAMRVTYDLRKSISEKIDRLPLKYFDTRTHGEVLSHITNDVDTISTSLSQSLASTISAVVTVIGILIMMFTINWLMALVAILVLPLSLGLVALLVKFSQKHYRRQQDYLGHINGHIETGEKRMVKQ